MGRREGAGSYGDLIYRSGVDDLIQLIGKRNPERFSSGVEIALRAYFHGVVDMLIEWVERGMEEAPEVLAGALCLAMPEVLRPLLYGD